MKRSQLRLLNDAHIALQEWANWWLPRQASLGHMSQTLEGKAQREPIGVQGSNYVSTPGPELMIPRRLKGVDRAYRDMPRVMRTFVEIKYLEGGLEGEKMRRFAKATELPIGDYYELFDLVRKFVAERL